jgi:hypothetical protein
MTMVAPQTVRTEVTFRDIAGALYDPAAVRFRLRPPTGAVQVWTYQTGAEIVRTSVGLYRIDVTLATAGVWVWRWEGGDDVATTAEGSVAISPSKVLT